MTTTTQELLANLKHYPDNTVVTIQDVDDLEFAIVNFKSKGKTLTIVIGESEDEDEEE